MIRRTAGRPQAAGNPLGQRLLALFGMGWLLVDFPLLSLWDRDALLFGLPLLPVALFVIWAALIALLAWVLEDRGGAEQVDTGGAVSQSSTAPGPAADPTER